MIKDFIDFKWLDEQGEDAEDIVKANLIESLKASWSGNLSQ